MQAKVKFLRETLNRKPEKESAFPMLLHFNYSAVIRPRCQVLIEKKIMDFNLAEVLSGTDADFCKKFDIEIAALREEKGKKKFVDENENLWVYVPGVWYNFII